MVTTEQIRAILFQDGKAWVAQCLEYDIGAQAFDLETLKARLEITLGLEYETSIETHGAPFVGIPPAPQHFHEMWERRSGSFTPEQPQSGPSTDYPPVKFALCA